MNFLNRLGIIAQLAISIGVLAAFFVTLWVLLHFEGSDIPSGIRDVLLVMTGVLAGAFKDVVGYWLGSSHGSQKKDGMIAEVQSKVAP
jgi:hypothetical protein